jgi:hypothetical protein
MRSKNGIADSDMESRMLKGKWTVLVYILWGFGGLVRWGLSGFPIYANGVYGAGKDIVTLLFLAMFVVGIVMFVIQCRIGTK